MFGQEVMTMLGLAKCRKIGILTIGIVAAIFASFAIFGGVVAAKHYIQTPCEVLKVKDGDTINICIPDYERINKEEELHGSPDGGLLKEIEDLRLEDIDCPEGDTEEEKRAKAFTEDFLRQGDVTLSVEIVDGYKWGHHDKRGKYRRLIGDLIVGGESLSDALVRSGFGMVRWS